MELLLIRHEETAGQDAQPQVSGPVQDPVPAAPALLDPATPCDRPEAAPGNFTDCYTRELHGLIWFVMSLGANAEVAADVAQSAFTDAFPLWPTIRHPRAWLRRVAERGYYRRGFRETLVESPRSSQNRWPQRVTWNCGTRPALFWPRWPLSHPSSVK